MQTQQLYSRKLYGHPIGLFVLAITELWERLSYYGLRGILILYLTHHTTVQVMGWENLSSVQQSQIALQILGWYMMFAYIAPVIGGWLADNYLGERQCIFWGGLCMALGKFIMAIPYVWITGYEKTVLVCGLAVLVLGNGLFKPNISSLVGKLYQENDIKRDAGFALFYMGINIGAFLGFVAIGWIASEYSYHCAFIISGIGMLIGMLIQSVFGTMTLGDLGKKPDKKLNMNISNTSKQTLNQIEKNNIYAVLIFSFYALLFFMIYEQIAGSFLLFTKNNTDLVLMGFKIPPTWVLSVNPAFIILFAPIVSTVFVQPMMKNIDVSYKYMIGYGFLAIAFLVAAIGALPLENSITYKVSIWWPITSFILITLAELFISPVGLSLISHLSPARFAGLMMGVFFFFLGIGNKLSTVLGQYIVANGQGYFSGFLLTSVMCIVIGIMIFMLRPLTLKLTQKKIVAGDDHIVER